MSGRDGGAQRTSPSAAGQPAVMAPAAWKLGRIVFAPLSLSSSRERFMGVTVSISPATLTKDSSPVVRPSTMPALPVGCCMPPLASWAGTDMLVRLRAPTTRPGCLSFSCMHPGQCRPGPVSGVSK